MINVKMQQSDSSNSLSPKITVIGVGGAGGNAVNNMIASNLEGCEFLVCNTDAQALDHSLCSNTIQLGEQVTGGLGAGSKPEVGQAAAEETLEEVMEYLDGANMAFVTAGMGGGTGTGAAPIIAKACRERGILTVGVVTKPFHFEGSHRMRMAEAGIKEMQSYVDTLIIIPNQNLFRIANEKTTFADGFKMADSVLQSGVRGVTDLMVRPGLVNLDFADIRTAMLEMGKAMMGTGEAEGEKRAVEAAEAAINNPLLDDVTMKGARGVLINVTGGYDMTLFEADEACNRIRDEVDPNANIIFGATFDEKMEGKMRVSIVATGIERVVSKESLERATPNQPTNNKPEGEAVPASTSSETQSRTYTTGVDNLKGITAPATTTVQEEIAASAKTDNMSEGKIVKTAKADDKASEEVSAKALRGTRYKDAFIPPAPIMSEQQSSLTRPSPAMNAPLAAPALSQPRAAATQTTTTTNPAAPSAAAQPTGLVLNPPKKSAPAAQHGSLAQSATQKTKSFFEKITGALQEHLTSDDNSAPQSRASAPKGQPSLSSPHLDAPMPHGAAPRAAQPRPLTGGAVPSAPAQGQLNIDAPAAPPKSQEEDFDIPAFLRRQAN